MDTPQLELSSIGEPPNPEISPSDWSALGFPSIKPILGLCFLPAPDSTILQGTWQYSQRKVSSMRLGAKGGAYRIEETG
jgi:hypothetical protein